MNLSDWFSRARTISPTPAIGLLLLLVLLVTCWLGVSVMILQRL
jgi:hypothetical protein